MEGYISIPGDQRASCFCARIMTTACIRCHVPIDVRTGSFFALSGPYHGLVHEDCLHLCPFDGRYPHALPVSVYSAMATRRTSETRDDSFIPNTHQQHHLTIHP